MKNVRLLLIPVLLVVMVGWVGCEKVQEEQATAISEPAKKKVETPAMQETKEMATTEEVPGVVEQAEEAAVETGKDLLEGLKGTMAGKIGEIAEPSTADPTQAVADKAEALLVEESKDAEEKAKKEIADKVSGLGVD